jgi:hypothetical protein
MASYVFDIWFTYIYKMDTFHVKCITAQHDTTHKFNYREITSQGMKQTIASPNLDQEGQYNSPVALLITEEGTEPQPRLPEQAGSHQSQSSWRQAATVIWPAVSSPPYHPHVKYNKNVNLHTKLLCQNNTSNFCVGHRLSPRSMPPPAPPHHLPSAALW